MDNEYDKLVGDQPLVANEYDAFVQDSAQPAIQQTDSALKAATTVSTLTSTSPDQAAETLKLAEKTKLPPDVISRNLDLVKASVQQNEYNQLLSESPKLSEWLAKSADNVSVSKDDYENLSTTEKIFTLMFPFYEPKKGEDTVAETLSKSTRQAGYQILSAHGGLEQQAAITQGSRSFTISPQEALDHAKDMGLIGKDENIDLSQGLLDNPRVMDAIIKATDDLEQKDVTAIKGSELYKQGAERFTFGQAGIKELQPNVPDASVKYYVGQATQAFFGSVLPLMGVGVATGGVFPALSATAKAASGLTVMATEVYGQHLAEELQAGRSIRQAQAGALFYSAAETIPEIIPLGHALKEGIPFFKRLLGTMWREGAQEMFTEVLEAGYDQGVLNQNMSLADAFRRVVDAGIVGALVGGGMAGAGHVSTTGVQIINERLNAKRQEDFFTALGDASKTSKLRERMPEKYQEVIDHLTANGPVENVYTPIEFFQSHFQEAGIDPREIATQLGIEKAYDQAVESGSKLAIPTGVYARRIAPTEHNAAFVSELTTKPDGLTSREAEDMKQEFGKQLEEFKKGQAAQATAFETSLQKVREDVQGQLSATMPADQADRQAMLWQERFRARSERLGIDPWELYQQRKLEISREGQIPIVDKAGNEVNPINPAISPMAKAEALHELGRQNDPAVSQALQAVDKAIPGSTSYTNFKSLEKIVAKGERVDVKKKKPYWSQEYVRDSYRFKTILQDFRDAPRALEVLMQEMKKLGAVKVLKIDHAKLEGQNIWGWRMLPVDFRMPNGQIVEYYFTTPEMQAAQDAGGHDLFEKWRELDQSTFTPEQWKQFYADAAKSKALYGAAWAAGANRVGLEPNAVAASVKSAFDSFSSTMFQSAVAPTVSPTGALADQTPSAERKAMPPSGVTTRTSPSGETVTSAIGAPPSPKIVGETGGGVKGQGISFEGDSENNVPWVDFARAISDSLGNPLEKIEINEEELASIQQEFASLLTDNEKDYAASRLRREKQATKLDPDQVETVSRAIYYLRKLGMPDAFHLTTRAILSAPTDIHPTDMAMHWGIPVKDAAGFDTGNKSVIGVRWDVLNAAQDKNNKATMFALVMFLAHENAHGLDIREGAVKSEFYSVMSPLFKFGAKPTEMVSVTRRRVVLDLGPVIDDLFNAYSFDNLGLQNMLSYPFRRLQDYAEMPSGMDKDFAGYFFQYEAFAQLSAIYYVLGATPQSRAALRQAMPSAMRFMDEVHNATISVHTIAERDSRIQAAFLLAGAKLGAVGSESSAVKPSDSRGTEIGKAGQGVGDEPGQAGRAGGNYPSSLTYEGYATVFASPNVEENLTTEEAQKIIDTPEHKAFHEAAQNVAIETDPEAKTVDVMGDWTDGAENSILTELPNVTTIEDAKLVGTKDGFLGKQKSVGVFLLDENGPDVMYTLTTPVDLHDIATIKTVKAVLDRHKIENRSIGNGKLFIVDVGGQLKENVRDAAQELKAKVKYETGKADFPGSATREEARKVFEGTVGGAWLRAGERTWGSRTTSKASLNAPLVFKQGMEAPAPQWYSALVKGVEGVKEESASPERWINIIRKLQGVKKDEIVATRLEHFLSEKKGKVTKQEIQDFLENTEVHLDETILEGAGNEPEFNHGSWETVEPDSGWLTDLADEKMADKDWEENARERIANRKGIAPEEVTEDALREKAYEEEYNNYYEDSESPQQQVVQVDVGNESYQFDVEESYGQTRINSYDGREVYEGRSLDEGQIEGHITEYLSEQGAGSEGDGTKFDTYVVPKGENYKEMFVTSPKGGHKPTFIVAPPGGNVLQSGLDTKELAQSWLEGDIEWTETRLKKENELLLQPQKPNVTKQFLLSVESLKERLAVLKKAEVSSSTSETSWQDGHGDYSDIENPVVRLRFNERLTEGKKTLFIEEIQPPSGVGSNQFARMPEYFQNNWQLIGIKRIIRYAAENGIDRISWTPGWIQTDRYNLSKQVDEIHITELESRDGYSLKAMQHGQERIERLVKDKSGIAALIGEKLADKAVADIEADKTQPHVSYYIEKDGEIASSYYGSKEVAQGIIDNAIGEYRRNLKEVPNFVVKEEADQYYTPKTVLKGLDLRIDDGKLRKLYDDIITNTIAKYIKQWDGKLIKVEIPEMGKGERSYEGPEYTLKELNEFQIKNFDGLSQAQNEQLRDVIRIMEQGNDYKSTLKQAAGTSLVQRLGGKYVAKIETASAFDMTPKMKEAVMQGQSLFQEDRGVTRIGADRSINIELLKNANLSTFLHESGHVFLIQMYDDVQYLRTLKTELTPKQQGIINDFNALLKWFNVTENELFKMDTKSVKANEQFARGWEAYLAEGKAPSIELRSAFSRFKAWLMQVYRLWKKDAKISQALNVHLNDEVRGIMDRLLATDEQIKAAQTEAEISPIFTDATMAGMSDTEFAAYQKTLEEANRNATEDLEQQVIKEFMRQRTDTWKQEREKVRTEIEADVDNRPIYKALAELKRKDGPRLDKDSIKKWYKDRLRVLPKGIMIEKGGIDPTTAAEMLGFRSGEELITQLSTMQTREKQVDLETDARMRQEHGDMVLDGTIVEKAKEAVRDSGRSEVILLELKALQKKAREVKPFVEAAKKEEQQKKVAGKQIYLAVVPTIAQARDMAEQAVASTNIRDIRPMQYFFAARKASKAAIAAIQKGDYLLAAVNKRQELIANEMYRAAIKAQAEQKKILDYLKSFEKKSTRERLAKFGAEYLEQIDAMIARYNLHPQSAAVLAKQKATLREWYDEQVSLGFEPNIDPDMLDEARRVDYRDVSMDELRALKDAVKSVAFLATRVNMIETARGMMELDMAIDEMVGRAEDSLSKLTKKKEKILENWKDRMSNSVTSHAVDLVPVETLMELLDGGAIGPWHDFVFNLASEAQTAEYDMNREYGDKIGKLIDDYLGKDSARIFDMYQTNLFEESISRYKLLSIALNIGNESNFDKMVRGHGWKEADVLEAIKKLNADDLAFVQSVWDSIETLYPKLNELQKKVSGMPLSKVEARPLNITLNDGTSVNLKGGYFPLAYDPDFSIQGMKQDTGPVAGLTEKGYTRGTLPSSFRKERSKFAAPLQLDLGYVLQKHLTGVIKDLSHRAFLIDMNRLLFDKRIRKVLQERLGREYERMFLPWLKGIANDRNVSPADLTGWDKRFEALRSKVTVVALGFKLTSILSQIAGISNSLQYISDNYGAHYLASALNEFTKNPLSMLKMVKEKSGEMRNRYDTIDREVRDELRRLSSAHEFKYEAAKGTTHLKEMVERGAFYGMNFMDRLVSVPTWLAAYHGAMDQIMKDTPGMSSSEIEKKSIHAGDAAVRRSQGAGGAKDLSAIQRKRGLMKILTMFYTPFAAWYGALHKVGTKFTRSENRWRYTPEAVMHVALITMFSTILAELLSGRGPRDCKNKTGGEYAACVSKWAVIKAGFSLASPFPVYRDIGNALESYAVDGRPRDTRFSPVLDSINRVIKTGGKTGSVMFGDKSMDSDLAFEIFETSGYFMGLPTSQPRITLQYLYDLMSGNANPENPLELMHDLAYRRTKQ